MPMRMAVGLDASTSGVAAWQASAQHERPQLLWRVMVLLAACVLGLRIWGGVGMIISILAAFHAMRGPRQTLEAFIILALLLIHGRSQTSLTRWFVLFAGFGRVLWDTIGSDARTPRIVRPLLVFFVTVLFLSALGSRFPIVSIFKVLAFGVGVYTILTSFHRTTHLRSYWYNWIFTLSIFVLFVSAPLAFSGLGYTKGAGFQGVLSHPQTFGPVAASMAMVLSAQYLFSRDRRWYVLVGAVIGWASVYMSGARTALLAPMLALSLVFFLGLFVNDKWRSDVVHVLFRPYTVLIFGAIALIVAFRWGDIQEGVMGFLMKDDDEATSVVESLEGSRRRLIMQSFDNFRSAPITGIGFGVPSTEDEMRAQLGFMGLPVGASVEKGFMPSAVLEETGLPGALLVTWLIFALLSPTLRHPDLIIFWLLTTALFINFGEMVFFSLGGMGMYFWILMGFCYSYAASEHAVSEHAAFAQVEQGGNI